MIKPITELKIKKNKEAVFLGCGPSINDVKKEQWEHIKKYDVWSSNSWVINKDIVPDFYHLEIKKHRNGPTVEKFLTEKQDQYKDVNWILDATRGYLLEYVKPDVFDNIFAYQKYYKNESGKYLVNKSVVAISCTASLTAIIDIMVRMGYEKIHFLGVDLYSSEYFWSDNEDYKNLDISNIIMSCKPDERDKLSKHPTSERKIQNFIAEVGEFNNIEMINLSAKSLLKDTIKTMSLEEFCGKD